MKLRNIAIGMSLLFLPGCGPQLAAGLAGSRAITPSYSSRIVPQQLPVPSGLPQMPQYSTPSPLPSAPAGGGRSCQAGPAFVDSKGRITIPACGVR
jgi:hypothetical protein